MEENKNEPVGNGKPVEESEASKPLDKRFNLNESEVTELLEEAAKVTNLKEAPVTSLEILYWEAQQKDPVKATEILAELEKRGKVPELLETERREIQAKRTRKTEKEIEKLRDKVRAEPKGVSDNLSKILKLKNVQLPSLFDTRTNHGKLIEDSVKKMRDTKKKGGK